MKRFKVGYLVIVIVFCLISLAGADDNFEGSFSGSITMAQSIPSINQDFTKTGTVDVTITKKSDDKFDVAVKTQLPDYPSTDDTNEYTLSGGKLTFSSVTDISGVNVTTTGNFSIAGSALTGTISTIGKAGGETQTTSTLTINATKK